MPDPYYQHHIFFCLNERDKGESRAPTTAPPTPSTTASRASRRRVSGPGQVRVNKAGCLDRCAGGPVAVVYPEGVWYTYVDQHDIDEIVDSHLKHGQVVERLLLPPDVGR